MASDLLPDNPDRRQFLAAGASALAVPLLAPLLSGCQPAPSAAVGPSKGPSTKQPNILFVFTDQERYMARWPAGMQLPGHEQLARRGVTFHQHYCSAVMCTSSRAVLLTGLQTTDNGMFENADMPYVQALSPAVPTVGQLLRKAGYYTAYKGKWHLDKRFESTEPSPLYRELMEAHGFADFDGPWDGHAHTLGGYHHDQQIAASAISWLRQQGQSLNAEAKPWSLFVSLVNPHDIMYFNADDAGEQQQDNGRLLMSAARAPNNLLYRQRWHQSLPVSLRQPLDEPGRPAAHREFNRAWSYALGPIPPQAANWQRFSDFYLNSIRSVDAQLQVLISELDALGLSDNTIIVFTADHGEMGGAHGLRGKGPFAYQEAIHVPLMVVHPQVAGGQHCRALTSHIDIAPSLLAMAGASTGQVSSWAGRSLPGRDFSPLLAKPQTAQPQDLRPGILFSYSGLATNDSELVRLLAEARAAQQDPRQAIQAAGYRPDMGKRGSLRSVFDGRYKFTRYFAPVQRNRPTSLDELLRWNDLELYDLTNDPDELNNLARDPASHGELLLAMNRKLQELIDREMGADDGREMPDFGGISWAIQAVDL